MSTTINMTLVKNREVGKSDIRAILRAVPKSYVDFVNSTADCMEKDDKLKDVIMDLIRTKPESDSGDVLKTLCNFYGFNKPMELVDDDEYEDEGYDGTEEEEVVVGAGMAGAGMKIAAY